MIVEELKEWFIYRLNNCYPVKHDYYPNLIFLYYDEKYIRKTKLSKLMNKEITLPSNVSGECLFALDKINQYFYCDSDNIWSFFNKEYSTSYIDVQSLIIYLLEETKINVYTSSVNSSPLYSFFKFKDDSKFKIYTSPMDEYLKNSILSKISVYNK